MLPFHLVVALGDGVVDLFQHGAILIERNVNCRFNILRFGTLGNFLAYCLAVLTRDFGAIVRTLVKLMTLVGRRCMISQRVHWLHANRWALLGLTGVSRVTLLQLQRRLDRRLPWLLVTTARLL